jgi:pimeloyl-ACP methyl ester carboxylesterase
MLMLTADLAENFHHDVWAQTPNGRIFVRVWNPANTGTNEADKSPIVLFHDSLGCVELWRSFPRALGKSTGRRIIAYDRLGHGKSDPLGKGTALNFIREEAEFYFPIIRDQLNIKKFVAFGHSVGGAMAVHCAGKFADACVALITESTQSFVDDKVIHGLNEAKKQFQKPEQFERLRKYHGDKAERVLNNWLEIWLSADFASWSLKPVLPSVTCDLLVIHGKDDEYGTTKQPQLIASLASGPSQVELLAGTHHIPHREQEKTVVGLVADFLRAVE